MKIGIFGGTFDPPHIGHVGALRSFLEQFEFDKVFVIPTFNPPHKSLKSSVSAQDRLKMTELAFSKLSDRVEISDLEINRQGKSYTADTIRHFKEIGYDEIYFLCGTDMMLTLDMWYKPDYIFSNAVIVYARRENDEYVTEQIEQKKREYLCKFNANVIQLNFDITEISSSEIRMALSKGDSSFLTKEVADYIIQQDLYKDVNT